MTIEAELIDFLIKTKDALRDKKLTKRQWNKFWSKAIKENFDSLKRKNPELLKKIDSLSPEELSNYLVEQIISNRTKKSSFPDEYYFLSWKYIYLNVFEEKTKRYNLTEARKTFNDLYTNVFLNKLKKSRFKIPHDAKKYVEELEILQEKYPIYLNKKLEREKTRKAQKSWSKKVKRDRPILLTHELVKALNPTKRITTKGLADVRTKLKRAKRRGFL